MDPAVLPKASDEAVVETETDANSVDVVDSFQQMTFDAEAELDALFDDKPPSVHKKTPDRTTPKASVSTVAPKGPITKKKSKSRSTVPHRTPPIHKWTIPPHSYPTIPSTTQPDASTPQRTRRVSSSGFQPTVPVPFRLRTEERFQSRNCPCCAHKKHHHTSPTSVVTTLHASSASPIEPTRLTKKY